MICVLSALCLEQPWAQETPKIQSVIADGLGVDFQAAQQNAAQNALTIVVGSFIDATSLIEQRTEIRTGIRDIAEKHIVNIKEDIKEYSQGTIQKIEILEVGTEGGLTRVTAKVAVRIDDFRAYIKKIAKGEVAVDQGLFAQAQVETKQRLNKAQLVLDNFLIPLSEGTVIDFRLSAPEPFSGLNYKGGDDGLDRLLSVYPPESIFKISVHAEVKPDYIQNLKQTLDSISIQHSKRPFNVSNSQSNGCGIDRFNDLNLGILLTSRITNGHMIEQYLIEGAGKTTWAYRNKQVHNKLVVSVLGKEGTTLQQEYISYRTQNNPKNRAALLAGKGNQFLPYFNQSASPAPWEFITIGACVYQLSERDFDIALVVESSTLKDARKIMVTLIPE